MKRSILLALVAALALALGANATASADAGVQTAAKKKAGKKKAAKCNAKPKAKKKGKARKSLAADSAAKKKGKRKASKCKAKPKQKAAPKPTPTNPVPNTPAPPTPGPGNAFTDGIYKDPGNNLQVDVTGDVVVVRFPLLSGNGCSGGALIGGDGPITRAGDEAKSNGSIDTSAFSVQWDLAVDQKLLGYRLSITQSMQLPSPCEHAKVLGGVLVKQ